MFVSLAQGTFLVKTEILYPVEKAWDAGAVDSRLNPALTFWGNC